MHSLNRPYSNARRIEKGWFACWLPLSGNCSTMLCTADLALLSSLSRSLALELSFPSAAAAAGWQHGSAPGSPVWQCRFGWPAAGR